MRRGAFPFVLGGDEASCAFHLESLELACLSISLSLQPIPLLDQILTEGVAVQIGASVLGQFLARPRLSHRGLGLGQADRPPRAFLLEMRGR